MATRLMVCLLGVVACESDDGDWDAEGVTEELRGAEFTAPTETSAVKVPNAAFCSIKVKDHGTRAMETVYLPNVLACEAPGGADLAMLKAQAIAARSYAYYHAATSGSICNGQGCQVFSCGKSPSALHHQAVQETSGVVLRHNGNLTIGFYVAGDKTPNADCRGNSSGVGNTEKWVTYNEGKSTTAIKQTSLGWKHQPSDADYGQNRGALSQWGAQCLAEERGFSPVDILRYYYGADIGLQQTEGACVGEVDLEVDGAPDACAPVDPEDPTIIDSDNGCMTLTGPSKYWRKESAGQGGTLHWTKSTETKEYNAAVWRIEVAHPGDYRLEVFVDAGFSTAGAAKYEVVDADASRSIAVDQTKGGWLELGVFAFAPDAEDQQVRLADAIGVAGQLLVADAVRVTPVAVQCPEDGCKTDTVQRPPGHAIARGETQASCSVGGSSPRLTGLMLLLLGARVRRRSPRVND